jgi:hypothetical protein
MVTAHLKNNQFKIGCAENVKPTFKDFTPRKRRM